MKNLPMKKTKRMVELREKVRLGQHETKEFLELQELEFEHNKQDINFRLSGRNKYYYANQCKKFIQNLYKFEPKLKEKIRVKQYRNISIFGTTSSAAFLDNILNKYNKFFVDENPKSQNRQFRNKKIYHPKYLDKNHLILLPFFKRNNKLIKILNKKYKPKFENF